MTERKNIAIIGAGFGGLRTALFVAQKLKKLKLETKYRVVLIDQNEYHTYTPALYEIAANDPMHTGYEQLREIVTVPISGLIMGLPIEHLHERVLSIDFAKRKITCTNKNIIPYSYLVLAPGSEPNYFNIPGLDEFSIPLKSFRDSIEIREYILNAIQRNTHSVQIVIGGAGTAGVELAGEIRCWLTRLRAERPDINPATVSIIEAAPTILSPFPQEVIKKSTKRLKAIGVKLLINERIISVHQNTINLGDSKTIPFDVLIWTGGVKASALMNELPLVKDSRGRVMTTPHLECSLLSQASGMQTSEIYGLGDAVTVMHPITNQPAPGTAQTAFAQARVVAHNIMATIQLREGISEKPSLIPYAWQNSSYIIPLGGFFAVARIKNITFGGFSGWALKQLVKLHYFSKIMPLRQALSIFWKSVGIILYSNRIHRRK